MSVDNMLKKCGNRNLTECHVDNFGHNVVAVTPPHPPIETLTPNPRERLPNLNVIQNYLNIIRYLDRELIKLRKQMKMV